MTGSSRYLPWLSAALGALYFAAAAVPHGAKPGGMDLDAFAKLPVVDGGRVKPLDTVARTTLMIISGRQTFRENENAPEGSVARWLLDVMTAPRPFTRPAAKYEVFRIDNEQLLAFLELKYRPGWYRYSLADIEPQYQKLADQIQQVQKRQKEGQPLDKFESKVLELGSHLRLYQDLMEKQTPLLVPPGQGVDDWAALDQIDQAVQQSVFASVRDFMDKQKIDLDKMMREQRTKIAGLIDELLDRRRSEFSPAAAAWMKVFSAYRAGDAERFNQAVADYRAKHLSGVPSGDVGKAGFEVFFNRFAPFYQCMVLYVVVFVLAAASWLGLPQLNRAALGLAFATLAVHTFALIARMYIQGRPPVTNLYSTAVFIGWGAVILGLIVEAPYRNGLGSAVAGLCGFATLIVAHFLAQSGDTMQMMQAVLDTNFWLATHVTVVTLGYTASLVAGFLGIFYILRGAFTPTLDRAAVQTVGGMVYGVACFATLLSFTGTVLGGIWADQSWGRFWGWDPKENGALLLVIWNALILHARWGGLVKQRGVAVLAALGCVVTTWSWFGTNQLGVGLHAYGGGDSGKVWALIIADLVFLTIGGLGMMPLRYWRSHAALGLPPAKPIAKTRTRREAPEMASS
jgi:ABC-type transport system involved in cytochrome c biogenesis permease subunit